MKQLESKRQIVVGIDEDVERLELYIAGQIVNYCSNFENSDAVLQNPKPRVNIWIINSTPKYTLKKMESPTHDGS